jgi:hypothetical protein
LLRAVGRGAILAFCSITLFYRNFFTCYGFVGVIKFMEQVNPSMNLVVVLAAWRNLRLWGR